MLRVLIGLGLLLMAVGFGAAGWQYWQGQADPQAAAAPDSDPDAGAQAPQAWLASASGGVVARGDARAYLVQDPLVPGRAITIQRTARLEDLLLDGEKLPDPPYLEVLADIRAPQVAEGLCPLVTAALGGVCQVHAARVVAGSVNPVLGTARFRVELVYRQAPEAEPLPDLAAHVLEIRQADLDLGTAAPTGATVDAALAAALQASLDQCALEAGIACRLLGLSLTWAADQAPRAEARIAWLAPLPEGMFIAPSLDAAPPEG